jgi:hypothetical protein
MYNNNGLYRSLISDDVRPTNKRGFKILAIAVTLGVLGITFAAFKTWHDPIFEEASL